MCDCFHMVLPTWPGAPGSVSGRQLQPEEPDAETEEDHSVTEGPAEEIIRPRPQGSSPVYECVTEGGFGLPEHTPSRPGSSGRRRSWWKRDSGGSRTFSRMSHSEEETEVTLKTEVEAGASGFSVTGGGDQGIFVKQVLKDSSAAKLFCLREGDQLLSTTIFFDGISYEDALKILQYSEPYKVQFKIKRRLLARGDEEWAASAARRAPRRAGKLDKDGADGTTDTPVKTLEGDGDQERLLSKPREGRGRRPQKERLSWPKFQGMRSRRGPRRSHSSSEAYERGKAPAVSPTSSDTEAQFPAEEQEPKAGTGSQRRRRFLSLRFKMDPEGTEGREGRALEHRPQMTAERERGQKTEGGVSLGNTEVASKDSKFKMPKFKMPSFGTSTPSKSMEASVEVSLPKAQGEVSLSSMQADIKTGDLSTELPPADVDIQTGELAVKLTEGDLSEREILGPAAGGRLKSHLPKVQMPSMKMPKVDFRGPQVDIKGPNLDLKGAKGEVPVPEVDVSMPSVEVDIKAPGTKLEVDMGLGDTEVTARDSKFKMPKFKMPTFGLSVPDKDLGTSVDMPEPRATGETSVPSLRGEMPATEGGIQIPSGEIELLGGDLELALTERQMTLGELKGEADVARCKSHLPKVPIPRVKVPKVDIKGPKVDLKGTKGEATVPEVDVSMPRVEVDIQAPEAKLDVNMGLRDKEVASRDSKYKMPRFKMPSFGTSVPSKSLEASMDVSLPKAEGEVSLTSIEAGIKTSKISTELPSADVEVKTGEVTVKLPEGHQPEVELHGPATKAGLKGHLPKVHMPSMKMPKVDFKGPQVDIQSPKVDQQGAKVEVTVPEVDVSMPSMKVDIQAPDAKPESDISLGDKEVAYRDSRFKLPKFKMPSFGESLPRKSMEASMDVSLPKAEGEVSLSTIEVDIKTSELSTELPSADMEIKTGELTVKLPEGHLPEVALHGPAAKTDTQGHLHKVHMPSMKMPKVDFKRPHVHIEGPKLDLKGLKGEVNIPDVDVSMPSLEVDIQAPDTKLEGDISLGYKEVASRDSKFKMPKFKMPSFGATVPSKSIEASADVSLPKTDVKVSLPTIKTSDLGPELPAADMDGKTGELTMKLPEGHLPEIELHGPAAKAGLKGHLPKVHMPSMKMPKVDFKGPQVDIKGPKLDQQSAVVQMTTSEVDVSMPSMKVDIPAPDAKLEGDISLPDKEAASTDSKFKMPKFKMPSFGASLPPKSSMDVSLTKAEGEVSLPAIEVDIKTSELSTEVPSADVEVKTGELTMKLQEGHLPEVALHGPAAKTDIQGHLHKMHMPSMKMPKVDFKGPQVDIKGTKQDKKNLKGEVTIPKVDVSIPSVEVDVQVPDAKLESDICLLDKEVDSRDSKFKIPKLKMPSFSTSLPSKFMEATTDVPLPKAEEEVSLPSIEVDIKTSKHSTEVPSADVEVKTGELIVKRQEGHRLEVELHGPAAKTDIQGHLHKVHMPSMKTPKVDFKGPQVDIEGPKLDLKGLKGEVTIPNVDVSIRSVEVDIQVPDGKLEGDISIGDKEVTSRDSKFKMPKFKMPSFGATMPSKSIEASADVSLPKTEVKVSLPTIKTSDLGPELPAADMDGKTGELTMKLQEGHLPEVELHGPAAKAGLKGHLPKVHMPSMKMPKVDFKGPQVDIEGPKQDKKSLKAEVTIPNVDVSMPSVEVDIQVPDARLESDICLPDKEVDSRDSKFKIPKLKMPSFGASLPSKFMEATIDMPLSKAEGEVSLPSIEVDIKTSKHSTEVPCADVEVKTGELMVKLQEGHLPEVELHGPAAKTDIQGHLPKVHMPSMKTPKVDFKGPQVDSKGRKLDPKGLKGEVTIPKVDVSMPSVEVDIQVPDAKLEGDISLGDKEVASRDSKFKMPKFKMPSFGSSVPSKSIEASADVSLPKAEVEVSLPKAEVEVSLPPMKTSELSTELPSADMDVKRGALTVKLPEDHLHEVELHGPAAKAGLKGHLPKVHMPSMKMPKVDFKEPQVDIEGPKLDLKGPKGEVTVHDLDMSMPSVEVDIKAPDAKLEGDVTIGDTEVASRDSKFKMSSFSASLPIKFMEASMDVSLPSTEIDIKTSELRTELPSSHVEVKTDELTVKTEEGHRPEVELHGPATKAGLKGHLSKVHMPSMKMPKVDFKGPQVDIEGPKLDLKGPKGEVSIPDMDVSMPSMEVDIQVPDAKLESDISRGDKEVASRDSKSTMPSFGSSVPSKSIETSADVSLPQAGVEVSLPHIKTCKLGTELPSADMDVKAGELTVKLPEGHLPEVELHGPAAKAGHKGHLPKVHIPSMKMPKFDFKGPQVDIKGPKLDMKGPKGEVTVPELDVSMPSVEVDIQAPDTKLGDISLGDKEVASRDSKFKMPKFKVPSFGSSVPGKSIEASADVSLPKAEVEVSLPKAEVEVSLSPIKTSELSTELPSADMDLKTGDLTMKLSEGYLPEVELHGPAAKTGIQGHLPKVHMPSMKMPKVDFKGPQLDIKGPKEDQQEPTVEVTIPEEDVSMPSMMVDIEAPDDKLEGDISLGDMEVASRDSKFKIPFFGASLQSKFMDASKDMSLSKAEAEVSLPSIQVDIKSSELSPELPSADMEVKTGELTVKLPEGHQPKEELHRPAAKTDIQEHQPKVHMPSMKMSKIDFKGPQIDIEGPKLDLKGPKGEVTVPELDVSKPSVEVDIQAPDAKLEGDISLGDKKVASRDSKVKMPKLKMPSFGSSVPSKSIEASVDVSLPKAEVEVSLPAIKTSKLSTELPSADMDVKTGELTVKLPEGHLPEVELHGPAAKAGLKGQLPTVHMPSMKMPKVDFKGPQVDIKGPKLDLKGPKGEVSIPELDVSMPSVEVDIQAPDTRLEGDISIGDKEVASRDSKFKMPKFKMPSFGSSVPSKSIEASLDVSLPKAEVEVFLPPMKTSELDTELSSADMDVKTGDLTVKHREGHLPEVELHGPAAKTGLKGEVPTVHMPRMKMPKVDFKGPQVDIKGPKLDLKGPKGEVTIPELDVSMPSVEMDIKAPDVKLEGDISLGEKEVASRDSKFKMPKFKMPSFGSSVPSKSIEASADVSLPKAEVEVSLPTIKSSELSTELPSTDMDVKTGELTVKLPEGHLPEVELHGPAAKAGLKGHLPKVHMPSMKMPKVDFKGPQVDIKGPKLDLKGPKGEVKVPELDVSVPNVEVDIQVPDTKLEGDIILGDKEVSSRDSKIKMPKFKVPSFGSSVPSKSIEASADVSFPKAELEVSLPPMKTSELSTELPSADMDVKTGELTVKLPEGHLPEVELHKPAAKAGLKGQLPTVHMPSMKMPKVDFKGPQVDIKGPKLDLKAPKGEVTVPELDVSMPSVEMDIKAPDAKLEGDISLGDKEVASRDSKFKMPKFKMPSFGSSVPSKSIEASADVSLPKAEVEVSLPTIKSSELSTELPSTDMDMKTVELTVKLPEGQLPEVELHGPAAKAGLKGHLPKVHMPSMKMPKVDFKGPQVDIKGPKLDLKGPKGEVKVPELDVSVPSVEVDIQVPDTKLEGDIILGDKEVSSRDSKSKMPKFKVPSFGSSVPSKSIEASADVSFPKAEVEVSLPPIKTSELSTELPSADMDVKTGELTVKLPEGHLPEVELHKPAAKAGLKGQLPTMHMPSMKMPKVDFKGPQVDIKGPKLDLKGPKGEVSIPELDVSMPSVEVDIQAPDTRLEGDISIGDKEVASRDSKFKMPKFKMPSFGSSVPSKSIEASVDVSLPKAEVEVSLPTMKTSELGPELPSADIDMKTGELTVKLPEGHLPEVELHGPAAKAGLKGHLPKVHMPSMKMPKVDFKGPQVDIKGPKLDLKGPKGEMTVPELDVSMPSVEVDFKAPDAKLEGDISLGDTEVASRDSKFKMPKFKMPSFGSSVPSKSIEASVDVSLPKAELEVSLPPMKTSELSTELPSADTDMKTGELTVKLPEGHLPEVELHGPAAKAGLKGQLPTVHMPSMKMPKVDFKGPQVDIKGPKLDLKGPKGEVTVPELDVSMPSVEVDIKAPDAKLEGDISLGDKEVAYRDSKFKMPKFKVPSFGTSVSSKSIEASVDVSLPTAEVEVSLPTIKTSELSTELPSADMDMKTGELTVKLPEGHLPEVELHGPAAKAGLKGHLPTVHMPSMKMPKVDFKGPQVDIKGPKLDLKGPKGEVSIPELDVSMPSVEVDIQAPDTRLEGDISIGDKEVASRDSKFKMPKFKMPSFGSSVPSKSIEASVDVSLPKAEVEVSLPTMKTSELGTEIPSGDIDMKTGELTVKVPEGHLPEVELHGPAAKAGLKGHLPKVHMPSMKMPKVDFKGPQVDIKGPKLDLKGPKGEMTVPELDVSMPSVEVDFKGPDAKLEGDVALGDTEVASRDSKFKMPKFKMPSFGSSVPSKSIEASIDVSLPKAEVEVSLPTMKTSELGTELPSADIDMKTGELTVKLPEGHLPEVELHGPAAKVGPKGHLPKVHMPSLKMPKVDFKGPQVDIKGPKLDLKGPKGEVSIPELDVSMPSVEVDIQAPDTRLEGDISIGVKEIASRDSKFKMPKFKMPSFGSSVPSKSIEASVDVSLPKAEVEVSLPTMKTSELGPELPSADMDMKTGELTVKLLEGHLPEVELHGPAAKAGLKGHLPKVHMPSMKMPKVDFKGPQVDIKGPKLDLKGPKGEVTVPELDVSMPSVEVDFKAPDAKLEGDFTLGDTEVASRDSKFKMPKFKMPSFGSSVPSKSIEASADVSLPKAEVELSLPPMKTSELSTELPSADMDVKTGELTMKLPEGQLPDVELHGLSANAGLKGHMHKVHMPSMKMPKVDFKGPQVDIKCPKLDLKGPKGEVTVPELDVSMPSVEVDIKAPDAKLEGDISLGDKEVASRDSKFKMPKFKMPSFGSSVPSKSIEASADVSLPKAEVEVSLPTIKTSELSTELPSADMDMKTGELTVKLPEGHLPEVELHGPAAKAGLKGQLPTVHMPSMKMPKVDFKGPQVDIKGPKLDVKAPKGEVTVPELDVSMPSVEVDIQVPDAKLEGDIRLGDKEVAFRDSKFKMPKFKMPSFGLSVPSKSIEASADVSLPKAEVEVSLPPMKTSELSTELPSADMDVKTGEVTVKLPEGHLPEVELHGPAAKAGLKGHLPTVHMPSMKMPKVDFKGPQVDIKGPKLDLRGPKGEVTIPDWDVSMPSVEVDIQAPDPKLEGDLSLGDKEVVSRDRKFKMPKFKMPSFGSSVPSKSIEASADVSFPKAEVEVSLPPMKTSELSTELPSADMDVKTGELTVKLPEGHLPDVELHGPAAKAGPKGHLPKVHMPSLKMPKVDFKGPQVDVKGRKLDLKGPKGEVTVPQLDVSMPSMKVDIPALDAKQYGDISLPDKEVASRDSKFKMPKFKMPSFSTSAPRKSLESSVDMFLPQAHGEVSLHSIKGDIKTTDLSTELPSAGMDVKTGELSVKLPEGHLPEVELHGPASKAGLKGHLPKVHMPSMKKPAFDFSDPQVDIKGPIVDLKSTKGEVMVPEVDVSLPSIDIQAPDAKVGADIGLVVPEVVSQDSKFKMPKFKMPSFGMSRPVKDLGTSVDVPMPKAKRETSLPSLGGDMRAAEGSIQLPSGEIKLPGVDLEVTLPEGELTVDELKGKAEVTKFKGHLPKVQMPSMKMPKVDFKGQQVDIKGPKLDLKGPKGEVTISKVDVSMPSMEVDIQVPGTKLEGDIDLGDTEVTSRDSKFKMPKVSMSLFGSSSSGSYVVSPHIDGSGPAADLSSCSHSADGAGHATDHSVSIVTVGRVSSAATSAEQSNVKKPHFKISSVFPPPGPCSTGLGSPDGDPGGPLPGSAPLTLSGVGVGTSLGQPCAAVEPSVQVPPPVWPSASSACIDVSGHHAESSAATFCEGVTLTKYQVTLPRAPVCPELLQETLSECQGDAHLSTQRAATLPSWESAPLSQTDSHPGPVDPLIYASYGRVTFPKFRGPKFRFSVSKAAEAKGEPCALGGALSPPGPAGVLDSGEAAVFPWSGTQLPSAGVSLSQGTEGPTGSAGQPATVAAGGEAEDTDRDGKGSPLKMPRLRLPGFRRSPKKGAERKQDPAHSLAVDAGTPGVDVLHLEAHMDVTPEKAGEKGRVKTPSLAVSHGPPGDSEHAVSSAPHATAGASCGGAAAAAASGFSEEAGENLHLPQVHLPTVGFVKPGLRPSQVQGEVSQSAESLPLPKHGLPLGDGGEERELGEGSASQPRGAALSTEDSLQAACGEPDPAAAPVRSPEQDSAAGAELASSQDSWFRMPSLRLPSFWRSSKERGGAGGLGTPSKGEVPAAVHSPGVCAPGSEVEADAAEVLRRSLDSKGLELHLPPAGTLPVDLPTSKARLCPGESSLPLQMPRERLSEAQAPPGETSETPAGGTGSAEQPSCPPEGPVRLKVSLADMPAQTSTIDRCQPWEDSVVTVKFPPLKVPRFTFPAPSCEADIFVPAVREVWCPDSSLDLALCKESPGAWGVSVLKAGAGAPQLQPVAPDLSSDASPISKVKVHIHGARVESQEVTVHSRVTTQVADPSAPETFSTQIVRESEVPASKIQTPSYGFSLLKGRVLESPVKAQVHVVTQDSQLPEGFQVASKQVTPGAAPVSGAPQPCTGEPFEMISSSVHELGPQTFASEACSGPPFADSCSDEEPAEILEFPPEDGRDEDGAAREKPDSKRSSGRFRFWLPSIGFSSSAGDTSADVTQEAQTPAPVRTQPDARPEAELPKRQEKAGWFRFPKLGFSSAPSKTSESTGDQARLAEPKLQEEAVTFFDAQESLSAEEREDEELAEAAGAAPGPCAMVASAARTELASLEQGGKAGAQPAPRPATK